MPRAIESAERLAPHREVRTSALLRESPLGIPAWPTRLPLGLWGTLMYSAWGYRIIRGLDPEVAERARAATAAEWLAELVNDGTTAVVLTHAVFRRLLGLQLAARQWRGHRAGGYRHWSAWSFTPG